MILQPAKVATPLAAVLGLALQKRVPPPAGWVAVARVMLAVLLVLTTLPPLSSTLTAGWVPQVAPLARRRAGAEGQLRGRAHAEVERTAGGAAEPVALALQGVGTRLAGDLAPGEGDHAAGRGSAGWRCTEPGVAPLPGWLAMPR